jgi:hypothetical protein
MRSLSLLALSRIGFSYRVRRSGDERMHQAEYFHLTAGGPSRFRSCLAYRHSHVPALSATELNSELLEIRSRKLS